MVHYIYHRSCWTEGEYVHAAAAQAKASRVWWLTHETNTDAMLLYDRIADKSGFVQYRKMM